MKKMTIPAEYHPISGLKINTAIKRGNANCSTTDKTLQQPARWIITNRKLRIMLHIFYHNIGGRLLLF